MCSPRPSDSRSARSPAGRPLSGLLATTALALGLAGLPALAQESVTDEALREQLQTRDAVIIELQRRLEQLERRLEAEGLLTAEPDPAEERPVATTPRPQEGLAVDELAAERALERTLVEEGALLLPAGQAEINPSVSFLHRDVKVPFAAGGQVFESRVKRDEFQFGLGANIGLPFDSQLELFLPYEVVRQDVSARGAGVPLDSEDDWGNAVGDVSIGLAKTLVREDGGWLPDIVVRGIYDSNTGEESDGNVPLGDGFHELRGQIVALKRQDPLAFIGAFTYSYTFEDDDVQPGQQFALSLGANLALSPETSLSVTLNQAWTDEVEIDGSSIGGSDQLASSFDFGGSAIIAPRTLLRVVSSIGLTDDAPDYGLRASVSYRFNLPFF
jgi:hypothetical protein